ncbi:MAG: aldehyde ferredoxin oxidoreductase family protein [Candidatus Lokiarchaeota archaeon]|nr:aldehyde ferredoxin oxidoreductase family protein [Candidatus Lokiarchaeota archaeon]
MTEEVIGKILEVDLNNQYFKENTVSKQLITYLLGGAGFAIDLLLKEKAYQHDPLDKENPLIFMTGLLTGTAYPCSAFYTVSARSPLTDIYGEGISGGFFGAELRKSLTGMVFKNKANSPVYLVVDDDHYELKDASSLWGMTTDKTITHLQSELGNQYKIACIGPSGEKQVLLSSIINDHHRAVGRTGMGAVMGSKNLKAIAVRSTKKVEYFNEEKFKEISKKIFVSFQKSPMAEILRKFGTNNITYFERLWDVPHKNWTLHKWREVPKISGEVVLEKYHVRNKPCHLCPFMCGREIEVKDGPYEIHNAAGVEYETTAAFGAMCLISDVEAVAYLNHLCNLMGVDTISTGCTIAFALDCYEHGVITKEDIGFPLEWGDAEAIVRLAKLMCAEEGIGKILSLGSKKASKIFGKESEQFLTDVKGLEAPMHDPRAIYPLGLQYATSNRGACHGRGYGNDQYSGFTGFNDILKITKEKPMRERTVDNPKFARDIMVTQNLAEVVNSLGICKQTMTSGSQIVDNLLNKIIDTINYLTGIRFTLKELMEVGDRIFTLKRLFNTKCGISKKDDILPPRLQFPLERGLTKQKIVKIDEMLEEYYRLRGWDTKGIPTKEKLTELKIYQY